MASISSSSVSLPELDVTRLHALPVEQQQLFLFSFVQSLHSTLIKSPDNALPELRVPLKQETLQIINLLTPSPSRVIGDILALCIKRTFTGGDGRDVADLLSELLAIATSAKADKDSAKRNTSLCCLSQLIAVAGQHAHSLLLGVPTQLLKQLKQAVDHAGTKCSIFQALSATCNQLGTSMDETTCREVWKPVRNAVLSDKAFVVQAAALDCLSKLISCTSHFASVREYEAAKQIAVKILETPSRAVRSHCSELLATLLSVVFSDTLPSTSSIKAAKQKRNKKADSAVSDVDIERPETPALEVDSRRLVLNFEEALMELLSLLSRSAGANRGRVLITLAYAKFLRKLGPSSTRRHSPSILRHLLSDLPKAESLISSRSRTLSTRRTIKYLVEHVLYGEMSDESAQLEGLKTLITDYISVGSPPAANSAKQSLTVYCATSAVTYLVRTTEEASAIHAPLIVDALLAKLRHTSYGVQIQTCRALRCLAEAHPRLVTPAIIRCQAQLEKDLSQLGGSQAVGRSCIASAIALSAMYSIVCKNPLHSSLSCFTKSLDLSFRLLKISASSELRLSAIQIQVAWILLGGLLSLGPSFVKPNLNQLLLVWKNALAKSLPRENLNTRSNLELSFLIHIRECALGALLCFLESNARLLTADIARRLSTLLEYTNEFIACLPTPKTEDNPMLRLFSNSSLQDLELRLRRRVLQCTTKLLNLSPAIVRDSILSGQSLPYIVTAFTNPDRHSPTSLSTDLSSAINSQTPIWELGDDYGGGITSLVASYRLAAVPGELPGKQRIHWLYPSGNDQAIEETVC